MTSFVSGFSQLNLRSKEIHPDNSLANPYCSNLFLEFIISKNSDIRKAKIATPKFKINNMITFSTVAFAKKSPYPILDKVVRAKYQYLINRPKSVN